MRLSCDDALDARQQMIGLTLPKSTRKKREKGEKKRESGSWFALTLGCGGNDLNVKRCGNVT